MMTRTEFEAAGKLERDLYLYDQIHPRVEPVAKPASYSNSHSPERVYKPIGDGLTYWTDLSGFSIKREDVPEDIIAKWEAEKANGEG